MERVNWDVILFGEYVVGRKKSAEEVSSGKTMLSVRQKSEERREDHAEL